jgi:hypothetical protein
MKKNTLSEVITRSKSPNKVTDIPTAGPLIKLTSGFENPMNVLTNSL